MFGCSRKRRGFTLVELLIVIIIIGILAGVMMLAAGSATDKAEATKIVNNLRMLKSAAFLRYAEVGSWDKIQYDDNGEKLDAGPLAQWLAKHYMGVTLSAVDNGNGLNFPYQINGLTNGATYITASVILPLLYNDSGRLSGVKKAILTLLNNGVPLFADRIGQAVFNNNNRVANYASMRIASK